MMQPLYTGELSEDHKRIVWSVLDSLLEGVGRGPIVRIESGVMFLASRKLSETEKRSLTVIKSPIGEERAKIGIKVR